MMKGIIPKPFARNSGDLRAKVKHPINYVVTESDEPEILNFVTGNNNDLGLVTEKDSGFWFLVVKIAQDFEVPSQRAYRFFVQVANSREEVVINLINLDDVAPYFSPADSKPCEVSVSNTTLFTQITLPTAHSLLPLSNETKYFVKLPAIIHKTHF